MLGLCRRSSLNDEESPLRRQGVARNAPVLGRNANKMLFELQTAGLNRRIVTPATAVLWSRLARVDRNSKERVCGLGVSRIGSRAVPMVMAV